MPSGQDHSTPAGGDERGRLDPLPDEVVHPDPDSGSPPDDDEEEEIAEWENEGGATESGPQEGGQVHDEGGEGRTTEA
jgi:hypothetical protein